MGMIRTEKFSKKEFDRYMDERGQGWGLAPGEDGIFNGVWKKCKHMRDELWKKIKEWEEKGMQDGVKDALIFMLR